MSTNNEFRRLPSVDKIISEARIKELENKYPHELIVNLARQRLEQERISISKGRPVSSIEKLVESIYAQASEMEKPSLRPVINATGVILHTNLGRAPLSKEAMSAMDAVAGSYCNLEFDLKTGDRGSRHGHIEKLLCQLTGAEAGMVVNNNASAVLLGVSALAKRKEVIVSRGEAIEIGGGFRIPDVMRQSGAKLIEVGTTNCTYAADFEQAITPSTAAFMRVHASNFQITGFTAVVSLEEMVTLAKKHEVMVLDDLGSGCFVDTQKFGLDQEPMVQTSISAGADLVFFSGDKLVGGPQAGIIVGKKQLIDKLKRHPLARAVRIDKVRLAGLAATLIQYLKGEALEKIPIWQMISAPVKEIDSRAKKWAGALKEAKVIDGESMVGGGSLPGSTLPTRLVAVRGNGNRKAENLAEKLRLGETPVIGRIDKDTLLLDPRSVLPEDDKTVIKVLRSLIK